MLFARFQLDRHVACCLLCHVGDFCPWPWRELSGIETAIAAWGTFAETGGMVWGPRTCIWHVTLVLKSEGHRSSLQAI
jgi:hypothetical protein